MYRLHIIRNEHEQNSFPRASWGNVFQYLLRTYAILIEIEGF